MRHFRKNHPNESAVAKHLIDNFHFTNFSKLKLLKEVQNQYALNAWESFFIHKNRDSNLLNGNMGPLNSKLFNINIV